MARRILEAFIYGERQIILNEIDEINATNLQNGFEMLRKLESDETKLWKLITNSIARDIKSFNYSGIFIKRIDAVVYKKINNLWFRVNQLQSTLNPKLWEKFIRILTESANKSEERATETMLLIKQIFNKAQTTNRIA